jgi:hypothetical protein
MTHGGLTPVALLGAIALGSAPVGADGGRVVLEGLEGYARFDPNFEGVRIILCYYGEPYSSDYIQGISGSAFRMAGICPCAPTCSLAMPPQELIRLLGYEMTALVVEGRGEDAEVARASWRALLPRVHEAIRAGRPVLVWNAFTTAEWDVVCGYDAAAHKLIGRGSYVGGDALAEADEMRPAEIDVCPPGGAMVIVGGREGAFDARAAELAALRTAVEHARTVRQAPSANGQWVLLEGIQCYDRWIADWSKPDKKREAGDSYCLGVYHSTRKSAAPFLREIAPSYPAAHQALEGAAASFADEAAALEEATSLIGWGAPDGPDAARNAKVVPVLTRARDAYAAGIAALEAALEAMTR